jgi:hypothetical protein
MANYCRAGIKSLRGTGWLFLTWLLLFFSWRIVVVVGWFWLSCCFLDDVLLLWVGGSDLVVVLVLSLGGSDLAVVVFQKMCWCCGWMDLIWMLFLLFHWVILTKLLLFFRWCTVAVVVWFWLCWCCFSDDVLLLWLCGSDLAVVVFQMMYCCCGWVDLIWLLLFFRWRAVAVVVWFWLCCCCFSDDVLLLWLGGSDLAEQGTWVWSRSNKIIKVT